MAKEKDVVLVSDSDFTLMMDEGPDIDLSVELSKLGWTSPKVKTRDLVGHHLQIKDYKRVVNEDDPDKWYFYCAVRSLSDGNDYCVILGGSEIKHYLEVAYDYNPRAKVHFTLGYIQHKADRGTYFIDKHQ
jgi:hypothetical protein